MSLTYTRQDTFTCNKLPNSNIFIAGGNPNSTRWEIRGGTGGAVSDGTLQATRYDHRAEVQTDTGNVLIVGGGGSANTWELRSNTGALVSNGSLNGTRSGGHSMTQY